MVITTTESVDKDPDCENARALAGDVADEGSSDVLQHQNQNQDRQSTESRSKKGSRRVSVYTKISSAPGVKLRLFSPPRQRQKWGSDQILPHTNWNDLFFDLFYVAAFYNLGNILVGNPSWLGILYFLGCYFPVIGLWTEKCYYDSQFTNGNDIFHKVFTIVVLVALATNVSSIAPVPRMSNPNKYIDMFCFSLSLTGSTLLDCARYLECYWFGRGQRKNIEHVAMAVFSYRILPLICYVASTIVAGMAFFGNSYDDDYRRELAGDSDSDGAAADCDNNNQNHAPIILLLAGYLLAQFGLIIRVGCFYPKHGNHKKLTIPLNINFIIHRNGELTMLVLGESVLSLLIVDGEAGNYHGTFYFGIVTVVLLQMLHFQSQPHDADAHALRRHKNSGLLFGRTYQIYAAALITVGASYKIFMYSSSNDNNKRRLLSEFSETGYRWLAGGGGDSGCGPSGEEKEQMVAHLFSWAMAIVFVCLDVMTLAHVGLKKGVDRCKLHGVACERTGSTKTKYNIKGVFFAVLPRGLVTIFIATLSLWEKDPSTLAGLGLVAVVCQLATRFMGNMFSDHDSHDHSHAHGRANHGGIDDEDEEYISEDDIDEGEAIAEA